MKAITMRPPGGPAQGADGGHRAKHAGAGDDRTETGYRGRHRKEQEAQPAA